MIFTVICYMVDWLIGWLVGWFVGWLVGWLNTAFQHWLGYISVVSPLTSIPGFTSTIPLPPQLTDCFLT